MPAGLTTHILDTARGIPAANIRVELLREGETVATAMTDADGRAQLLQELAPGVYELQFSVGAYLATHEPSATTRPQFLDVIPIRFGVSDPTRHHHVPLLLSAHGYSTYRGS